MNAIEIERVTKSFRENTLPAVNECSLSVQAGSFVVLLGPSGCGKTTLLKMVNRLYEPDEGRILLDGQDIQSLEPTSLRRRIGYVIQQVGLFPHMSVAQNVAITPELAGWQKDRIHQRVDELLNLVGMPPDEYRARYPAQLSGGQSQRVGLARALAADPGVMLMDEPFGAIDAISRGCLQEEMLALQAKLRKTILFVTHDVEEALRLADWIAVMREGRIVQYARPLEILTNPADSFVAELIGAEDILRRLGLLRADSLMEPLPPGPLPEGQPLYQCGDSVRQGLSLLLKSGEDRLVVYDREQPAGILSLDRIRAVTRSNPREGEGG